MDTVYLMTPEGLVANPFPLRYGRVEFDISGGYHSYPIPQPGFYNLNGTMNSACPAAVQVPGKDVCVVACTPPGACLADNVCAPAYRSIAPTFRCSSCNVGFYSLNG
jgi:hypothetical protein